MKKTLLTLAVASGALLASTVAQAAFLPVTIDETQLGVGTNITTNVGKLNGGYIETVTIKNDLTFGATAFATFGQLFNTAGIQIPQLGGGNKTGLGGQYNMYAVFNSTGYVSSATSFTGLAGSFKLYLDKSGDATPTFGADGFTSVTVSDGNNDDILIASSSNMTFGIGQGVGTESTSFKFLFDHLSLTNDGAQGDKYFVDPKPFYLVVNVNGDFDDGLGATAPGTYAGVTGDVSANFELPEPGSLALIGVALAGLGMVQRRRKQGLAA